MDSSVFSTTTTENGYEYYTLPKDYPLYKASRNSKEARNLAPGRFYFFGVKNESPEYIESFEKEYGIIFEFKTVRPYKLLAMDTPATLAALYKSAPPAIQTILIKNYGHGTGIRDSIGEKDSELSQYICNAGFDGYAIHTMKTTTGGTFHSEFMICNTGSMQSVKRVTTEVVANRILEKQKLDKLAPKKKTRKSPIKKNSDSPLNLPNKSLERKNLFGISPVSSSSSKSPMKKARVSSPAFMSNKSPEAKNLFGFSPVSTQKSPLRKNLFDSPGEFPEFMSNKSPEAKNLFGNSPVSSPLMKNLFHSETPGSSRKTKRKYTPTPDK